MIMAVSLHRYDTFTTNLYYSLYIDLDILAVII